MGTLISCPNNVKSVADGQWFIGELGSRTTSSEVSNEEKRHQKKTTREIDRKISTTFWTTKLAQMKQIDKSPLVKSHQPRRRSVSKNTPPKSNDKSHLVKYQMRMMSAQLNQMNKSTRRGSCQMIQIKKAPVSHFRPWQSHNVSRTIPLV